MTDAEARDVLAKLLDGYTSGSVLHLLGDVLRRRADEVQDGDPDRAGRLRNAETVLFAVGIGIDAVAGE